MPLYTFCRLGGGSNVAMKIFRRALTSILENPDSSGLRYPLYHIPRLGPTRRIKEWRRSNGTTTEPSFSTPSIHFRDHPISNMSRIELRENTKRGGAQATDWLRALHTFAVPPYVPMKRAGLGF